LWIAVFGLNNVRGDSQEPSVGPLVHRNIFRVRSGADTAVVASRGPPPAGRPALSDPPFMRRDRPGFFWEVEQPIFEHKKINSILASNCTRFQYGMIEIRVVSSSLRNMSACG